MTGVVYTRGLTGKDGSRSAVTSSDHDIALERVVGMMIDYGEKPPKWWQFWLWQWPDDAVAEYHKQMQERTL